MATFPICYKTPYKDQNLPTQSVIRQNDKRFMHDCDNMLRSFSSVPGQICRSCHPSNKVNSVLSKSNTKERNAPWCIVYVHKITTDVIPRVCSPDCHVSFIQGCYSKRENLSAVRYSAESSSVEKQLRSLDSYFGKLQDNSKLHTLDSSNKEMQLHHRYGESRSKNGLKSLDEYLGKLNNGVNQRSCLPSSHVENSGEDNLAPKQSFSEDSERANFRKRNTYVNIRRIKDVRGPSSAIDSQQHDDTSSLYLIGTLTSVNIAVFLFEIASPIRNADVELFSLPLLYGAKINHLIVIGEWWRLVTPMFLVQD